MNVTRTAIGLPLLLIACGDPEVGLPTRPAEVVGDLSERPEPDAAACASYGAPACTAHADCAGDVCVWSDYSDCYCAVDDCAADADCPSGQVCACAGDDRYTQWGETITASCRTSGCRTDADCAEGPCMANEAGSCGQPSADVPPWILSWECATRRDRCRSHDQCPSGTWCIYDTSLHPARFACAEIVGITCD